MNDSAKTKLLAFVDRLITEGEPLVQRILPLFMHGGDLVPFSQPFAKWQSQCRHLMKMLGDHAEPWEEIFSSKHHMDYGQEMCGHLQAVRAAIQNDLFISVEEIVRAEVFGDLLEQADHLLEKGYFLAAGVLCRAVLEDHLRRWCDHAGSAPTKPKPTLDDFKTALYSNKHVNLLEMKHVESMAATGNAAAHNKPLKQEDVERFLADLKSFLVNHPIS